MPSHQWLFFQYWFVECNQVLMIPYDQIYNQMMLFEKSVKIRVYSSKPWWKMAWLRPTSHEIAILYMFPTETLTEKLDTSFYLCFICLLIKGHNTFQKYCEDNDSERRILKNAICFHKIFEIS